MVGKCGRPSEFRLSPHFSSEFSSAKQIFNVKKILSINKLRIVAEFN